MEKTLDRRVLKTRNAIERSFIALLEQKGFDALSVKDIAAHANVGRKTFYLHFHDLYDLLNHVLDKEMAVLSTVCEKKEKQDFAEGALLWFRYFEGKRALFVSLFASRKTSAFRERLRSLVMEDLRSKSKRMGVPLDEVDRHFFGMAIIGIIEGIMLGHISADADQIARRVGSLLERNMRSRI